ncbi:MAG: ABC transporter ATP-binding protein [Bacillota bacterium]|uniref:ABC transporter ATP-binding protein n=1 Tax=Bacillus sp. RO2 TaxID=2723913 RepID=UPI00145F095F|nr:ABC transporter ATP-binding protein [Bacillus sp. RO2]MEA3322253.1 ABC transporter ATP-binding protein [Bacillota bacterium]NMH73671.1 ABC transporter ATP-binding protein [Bacillus sp. RO2]
MTTLLKVEKIQTYIEQFHILQGVDFEAKQGEVTVLLGRNGAGKTTTLRSVMGLNPPQQGSIVFNGQDITGMATYDIANIGIGYVPEDQGVFGELTVEENMKVAMKKTDEETLAKLDWVLDLFPDLKTYWKKRGGNLSGGQKQMLAISRAYINDSKLLLIDEPSKGLAPIMVEKVMDSIQQMKKETSIILVEQNFYMASTIGDCFYILDDGKTVHHGHMHELKEDEELRRQYLGIA